MTDYLYSVKAMLYTFDCIVKYDGKNIADIVKAEEHGAIRGRIDEFVRAGLAKKYDYGYKEVHLTRKGYEVMLLLQQAKKKIESKDGADCCVELVGVSRRWDE